MSRRELLVRPQASAELREAFGWYQEHSETLALRFRHVVLETFDDVAEHPERWPVVRGSVRRVLTPDFPYAVFYSLEPAAVVILAVIHQAANPSRWPTGA